MSMKLTNLAFYNIHNNVYNVYLHVRLSETKFESKFLEKDYCKF